MRKLKSFLREFRALRLSLSLKFIIGVAVALTITMGVSLYFISKKHEKLVLEQLNTQARALFKQLVITRKWIADHGGVFIRAPWEEPSPYFSEPEIVDIKGRKYIKQSPAMVTKELSRYAQKEGLFTFHITSLKLINPENAPDEFERAALVEFEKGTAKELSKIEKIGSSYFYRYIAPLYVEQSCLKCHAHLGYKLGDVRGAMSVSIPMDYAISMINSGRKGMVLASIATISILMLILYVMLKELVLRPVKQLKASMKEFSTGQKTEISVISTGDEFEDLSRSFVNMSRSLTEYHTSLQDKVRAATKSLEDANARLIELNEKKSEFIAKISHELRTPLTSIKGAMDYISTRFSMRENPDKDMSDIIGFFEVIKNNSERLIRMVNDTLDLERIESGVLDLHFSQVNLLSLIKEVITSFRSIASEKNITFKIEANPKTYVTADEDRIRQVMINLISNAIKFSPADSEIHIMVTETAKAVTVYVKDTGQGISAEEEEKVFDKFYTKGTKDGTGLGLAICKGIIEAHNGEIKVSNNKEERGCTFYFTLPKRKESALLVVSPAHAQE